MVQKNIAYFDPLLTDIVVSGIAFKYPNEWLYPADEPYVLKARIVVAGKNYWQKIMRRPAFLIKK